MSILGGRMLPNMLILSHFCIPQLALLPKNPLSTVNVYAMIGEDGVRLIDPCSEERQLARPLLPWNLFGQGTVGVNSKHSSLNLASP